MVNVKLYYGQRNTGNLISTVMDDVEESIFYDDEDDFIGQEYLQDAEYEYEYEEIERETLFELYQYCFCPTVYDTITYILPLLISTIIFRLCVHSSKIYSYRYIYIYMYI